MNCGKSSYLTMNQLSRNPTMMQYIGISGTYLSLVYYTHTQHSFAIGKLDYTYPFILCQGWVSPMIHLELLWDTG